VAGILAVNGDPAVADFHAITGARALTLVLAVASTQTVSGVSFVDDPTVTGVHNLHVFLVHAVAGTLAVSGVSSVDGLIVTGVHNLHVFLVHAVAGTLAVSGVCRGGFFCCPTENGHYLKS
jgi:hypothetical protein